LRNASVANDSSQWGLGRHISWRRQIAHIVDFVGTTIKFTDGDLR
jgi:hypothetical protein